MPFGSLTAAQRVTVLLELLGGPQYAASMAKASAATGGLARATTGMSRAATIATRRTFLWTQAMFTLRRYAFYGTLALGVMAAAVVKLGLSYLSARQQASVALGPVFKSQKRLNDELDRLFILGKYSPFVLSDMTVAFRLMYGSLHPLGVTTAFVNRTLKAMIDALSFAGKTAPANLQRVSYALQHMVFQGRLTGYTINQLARDGIPILPVLNKYLGITGDQLHRISTMNIPTIDVLKMIDRYIETTAGYRNAAYRMSIKTVHGMLQVLKDSVSQLTGIMLAPIFTRTQGTLFNFVKKGGILDQIQAAAKRGGTAGAILEISRLMTGSAGPGQAFLQFTQILRNLGLVFGQIVIPAFLQASKALIVYYPVLITINKLLRVMLKLGWLLKAILIVLFVRIILLETALIGWKLAVIAVNLVTLFQIRYLGWLAAALFTTAGRQVLVANATKRLIALQKLWMVLTTGQVNRIIYQTAAMTRAQKVVYSLRRAFIALRGALLGVSAAELVAFGWIAAVVVAVGILVILYFRWKRFHDLVDMTAKFIWRNWKFFVLLISLTGPWGWIISRLGTVIKYWRTLWGAINNVVNVLKKVYGFFGRPIKWLDKHFGTGLIHKFAAGGVMPYSGLALVGERGPEVAAFPSGTRVFNNRDSVQGILGNAVGDHSDRPIVVQVLLDRKVLAQGVARANQDREARR